MEEESEERLESLKSFSRALRLEDDDEEEELVPTGLLLPLPLPLTALVLLDFLLLLVCFDAELSVAKNESIVPV